MKDLTKGNIYKTFLSFSLPVILSGLLSQSYNVIDTAIAGRWLGEEGLGEIGCSASFITVLSSLFWGFTAGGGVLVGMAFGKKDFAKLKSTVITTFIIALGIALAVCPLSVIFREEIFDFLKVDTDLREGGYTYFTVYISGLFLIVLTNFGVHIFNAIGDSAFPLKMTAVSAVLNVCGNLLSVTVFNAGVFGVALSSVISALIVDILFAVRLFLLFRRTKANKNLYRFSTEDGASVMRIALPGCCQQMILYGASFLVAPFINGAGMSATAAYAVIGRIFEIATSLYQNSTRAVTSFSSQCIGSKQFGLLKRAVKAGFLQALAFLVPLLIVFSLLAPHITSLFFKDAEDTKAVDIAMNFVRFWMPLVVINVVNNLFHAFWRGTANMRYLVLGTFVGALAQVVFTYTLAPRYGINGIWTAWVLCWSVEAIFNFSLYKLGKWEKRLV